VNPVASSSNTYIVNAMGIDCGFDIYPPLERTPANQVRYELFLHEVLAAYGLQLDDGANTTATDSDNIICVETESKKSYIEFMVGEHPYLPRRCEHLLRFSSKVSGRSVAEPHIRRVCKIARQHFGDRVYFWHDMDELGSSIRHSGCYNWCEVYAARRRMEKDSSERLEQEQEEQDIEKFQDEPGHASDGKEARLRSQVRGQKLYTIKPVPGRGQGVLATSNIPKGTRILLEAPLFKLPDFFEDVQVAESFCLQEVKRLSKDQQRAFLALQNVHGRRYSPFLGVMRTNMLPLSDDDEGNGGLFVEASRINHSCRPNAQCTWNANLGCITVHAIHNIETGSEITISYVSGASMDHMERRQYLMEGFYFQCQCELCSLTPLDRLRSDDRLEEIRLIEKMSDDFDPDEIGKCPTESLNLARRLSELLVAENIEDFRLPKACMTAFRIAVIVGDKARAKAFAERAYAARKLLSGDDNPTTIMFKRLAERPVEHPLYSARTKCYSENWEPPQGLGGEEFEKWLWNTDEWESKSFVSV
jgi:hypothetical protein